MTELQIYAQKEVTRILLENGIPANLQGFRCLRSCTLEVLEHPEQLKHVTKGLYETVANQMLITSSMVERSMRHSTDVGYCKTGFKPLCALFNITGDNMFKPTNAELIAMLVDYIRMSAEKNGMLSEPKKEVAKKKN